MGYTYYNPLKVWLDPASIADVVSYMQKYLSENPIKDTEEINQIVADYIAAHPEIIGGVQSVNGKTGDVVLTASDINTTGTTTIQAVLTSLSSQISDIAQTVAQNTDDISDLNSDVNTINTSLGKTDPSTNLLDISAFSNGYYSSSVWTESNTYVTSDYMPLDGATDVYLHRFNLNNGQKQDTARYIQYIYWFDNERDYLNRSTVSSGVTDFDVLNGASYFRVMMLKTTLVDGLASNKGFYAGTVDTDAWVEHTSGGIPNYAEIINSLRTAVAKSHLALTSGIYTISTAHARYTVSRITDAQKHLDTFRLYSGSIVRNNNSFNMWTNSDAEGAILIQGESDYVSGYHGSEVMIALKIFMDGTDITSQTSIDADFDTLMFYVESDVYHCYQNASVADTIAFKRCKIVSFSGNKVTISNSYIPQENLNIASARIALFQCYKSDDSTPVFTDFSVNTDFKNYLVSTVGTSKPTNSNKMTEAILNTTYGRIRFKSILTSGQSYLGSVVDFASQNRVKFYFDTISSATVVQSGEQIMSQFDFEII